MRGLTDEERRALTCAMYERPAPTDVIRALHARKLVVLFADEMGLGFDILPAAQLVLRLDAAARAGVAV
jgi:hypothetical protein